MDNNNNYNYEEKKFVQRYYYQPSQRAAGEEEDKEVSALPPEYQGAASNISAAAAAAPSYSPRSNISGNNTVNLHDLEPTPIAYKGLQVVEQVTHPWLMTGQQQYSGGARDLLHEWAQLLKQNNHNNDNQSRFMRQPSFTVASGQFPATTNPVPATAISQQQAQQQLFIQHNDYSIVMMPSNMASLQYPDAISVAAPPQANTNNISIDYASYLSGYGSSSAQQNDQQHISSPDDVMVQPRRLKRPPPQESPQEPPEKPEIRAHQSEKWQTRYEELREFHSKFGHSVVPYHYKESAPLAWWVKR
jgi:hypothetical protein